MKRTKRYGGFLVGDRVQRKDGLYDELKPGVVVVMRKGRLTVQWEDLNGKTFKFCFMPNQLINLTRQNEEMKAKRIDWKMEETFKKIFGKSSIEAIRDSWDLQAKYLRQDFVMPTIDWESVNIDIFHQDRTIRFSPSDLPSDTPLNEL